LENKISLETMINGGDFPFLKSIPTSCTGLKKLGTEYGGWDVPVNKIEKNSICYCVGAGEDISFDVELVANFECEVFIFDPTPRAKEHFEYFRNCNLISTPAEVNPPMRKKIKDYYPILRKNQFKKLRFIPYGIWLKSDIKKFYVPTNPNHVSHSIINLQHTKEYFEAQCVTIREMMVYLNHDKLEILKLDIEGVEYDVIDSILQDNIEIKILCVEFDRLHHPQDDYFLDRAEECIRKLAASGFAPFLRSGSDFTFVKKEIE